MLAANLLFSVRRFPLFSPFLSIWIALSQSRRTFDYRGGREYFTVQIQLVGRPLPVLLVQNRRARWVRRTGEPDAVNLAWLAVSARLFCAGKTGGREPKSYLYMITFPLRPRPLHVSQSETCKMVSCQPPVFPFSFLPLSFTVRQTRCRSERGGRENGMRKTGLGRPSASSLPCGKLASGPGTGG